MQHKIPNAQHLNIALIVNFIVLQSPLVVIYIGYNIQDFNLLMQVVNQYL